MRGFKLAVKNKLIAPHDPQQFIVSIMGMCVMPFVGKNLIKSSLGLSEAKDEALLKTRADEIKRYVVLLLTPAHNATKESSHG